MTRSISRQLTFPQPPAQVWAGIADGAALAEWLFPNDFVPRVGHRFTFEVPPNPAVKFDGMTIDCVVLACDPPHLLAFSWSAGGLVDTRVSFTLEPDGAGTRLLFEHAGFDVVIPGIGQAFRGAEYGWARMLGQLPAVVAGIKQEQP
jgi:uncharacterized protein YndB with AHSA1/START domain